MALHLVDANALFVHIPKTGGVWVEEALPACGIATACPLTTGGVSWRHPLPADIRGSFDFTFTFVRHPISWYESWWRFASSRVEHFEPGGLVNGREQDKRGRPCQREDRAVPDTLAA